MINERAQPIYIYPDQLITETWPDWVETIFTKVPSIQNRNNRGFQELAGGDNSSVRTRAGEAYRIGLLLHRVIRERDEGTATPKGWDYVCNDKTVLSKVGHLSYAVGKALSEHSDDADVAEALNVLNLFFALSLGTSADGKSVSTALIYRRVLQCFRNDVGQAEFDAHSDDYARMLAAAVFQTLDTAAARANLLNEYVNSDHITSLILKKESDGSEHAATVANLMAKVTGMQSSLPGANEVPRAKAALFWAAPDRGIYAKAAKVGNELFDALISLDRISLGNGGSSVLNPALCVDANQEHMLLEKLNEILVGSVSTFKIWGSLMEKLSKGVYSALAYLEDTIDGLPKPKLFHLHGIPDFPIGSSPLNIEITRSGVPIRPEIGASVIIRDVEYCVKGVDEQPTIVKLTVELVQNSVLVQP